MTFFEEIRFSNTNVSVDSSLPLLIIFIRIKTGNYRKSTFIHCNGKSVNSILSGYDDTILALAFERDIFNLTKIFLV